MREVLIIYNTSFVVALSCTSSCKTITLQLAADTADIDDADADDLFATYDDVQLDVAGRTALGHALRRRDASSRIVVDKKSWPLPWPRKCLALAFIAA